MEGRFSSASRAVAFGALFLLAAVGPSPAMAQDGGKQVVRCPGPPVLYTDNLSPAEARERGCRAIEGAPLTIVQGTRPRAAPAAGGTGGASTGAASGANGRGGETRVDPAAQRARDSDARRILADELRREEEKLAAMNQEYNRGEPERRGDERNYQRYIDRVAEMKAGIARKEADIAAIRRELGKLAQ